MTDAEGLDEMKTRRAEIFSLYSGGVSTADLSAQFGISKNRIQQIVNRARKEGYRSFDAFVTEAKVNALAHARLEMAVLRADFDFAVRSMIERGDLILVPKRMLWDLFSSKSEGTE